MEESKDSVTSKREELTSRGPPNWAKARWWRNSSKSEKKPKSSSIWNVGFVRSKWPKILMKDEEETPNSYELKKEIFEMMRRQERSYPLRANITQRQPRNKLHSRNAKSMRVRQWRSNHQTNWRGTHRSGVSTLQFLIRGRPDVKVNVGIGIIKSKAMFNKEKNSGKSYQFFKSYQRRADQTNHGRSQDRRWPDDKPNMAKSIKTSTS